MTAPKTILFDLSEVLIAGLLGVERAIATRCQVAPEAALAHLGGEHLWDLCRGRLTEQQYLDRTYELAGWELPRPELQQMIRQNFGRAVADMEQLLLALHARYELVLVSDHAREWVEHIRGLHSFLTLFRSLHFSFELGSVKAERACFEAVLGRIGRSPPECLFIDDSPRNIAVAASLGIACIHFTTAAALAAELRHRKIL